MAATIQIIANLQNNAASPIKALRTDIEGLGTGAEKSATGFSKLQAAGAAATGVLIAGIGAAAVAIGGFTVSAVKMAADMEAQISGIAAVWNSTAEAISPVKDLIQNLGLDPNLKVTAVEAAAAIEMLAKNGLTMDQVLQGAAHSTVLLANATGGSFELAASIATDTMAMFNISAEDMKTAVDGITSVTVNSKFAIEDYALALAQGGGVASMMGVSFADFNTALVATASYFKSGSDAGTSFKTFLQRLIPVSSAAKDVMQQLGIITADGSNQFYDAQGNMRGMAEIAGVLHTALSGLTEEQRNQAMTTMFGADAMRFAGGIAKYTAEEFTALQKVMGNTDALEQAKTRVDNFRGAWEIFLGVIEGLQIQLGSALLPMLRLFVEFLTKNLVTVGASVLDTFGRVAEAFNMFFEAIGEGASPLQALAGLVQQVALAFGLTMEQATNLGNAVSGVVSFIVMAVSAFAGFITQFISWKDVLLGVGIAIASFVIPLVAGLVGSFLSLIAPIVAVIAVVALLRAAYEANFLGIKTAVESLFGVLQNVAILFGQFAENLRSGEGVLSSITQLIMNVGLAFGLPTEKVGQLMQGFTSFVSMIQGMFAPTLERIKAAFEGLGGSLEPVGQKLTGLWEAFQRLGAALLPILALIGGALLTVGKLIGEVFAGLLENAGKILGGVIDFITGQISGLAAIVSGVVNVIKAVLQGDWAGAWEAAKTAVSGWWSSVQQSLSGVAQVIDGVVSTIWNALANLANDLLGTSLPSWEEFKQGILDKIAEIPKGITDSISDFTGAVGDVVQAIKDVFTGDGDWTDVGAAVMDLIKQGFETAVTILDGVWTAIRDSIFDWADAEDWQGVAEKIIEEVGSALSDLASSISDQLESWRDAIFDWADAEDWQGVAEAIVEKVGDALADLGDSISDQLESWREAIFDWADAEDWQGVAEAIVEKVGDALGSAADAIGDFLEPWREAIFNWADAEDWQGVAEKIIEEVGSALSDLASNIGDQLESWRDAIFDWAEGESWSDVGLKIVEMVIEGLTEFVNNAADAVADWFAALTDAINGIDWYQLGYDIITFIIEGLAEFVTNITETVSGWYTAIKTETEGKTWTEIATGIVAAIILGLANFVVEVATTVVEWYNALKGKIDELQASFQTLGGNIVSGIISGITAAASGIYQAMVGIAMGALQAARDALGIHSPSTVFAAQVGQPISEGIALGILQAASAPIAAISDLAKQVETAGVKAFAEAMKAVGEAIEGAIAAFIALSGFGGVESGGASEGLAAIVLFMKNMVDAFVAANEHSKEALELVEKFAGAAEAILSVVTESLLPLHILASIDLSFLSSAQLAAGMIALRNFLFALVTAFAEAAAELGVLGSLVEAFSAAAESVVGLIEDSLQAIFLLSGFNFGAVVQGWHLAEQIETLRNILQTMVREFAEAALEFSFMGEAVETFTAAAESVVGLIEDSLQAVFLLSGFNFGAVVQGWHLAEQIETLRNILRTMVREFAEAALEFSYMGDAVEAFSGAAESVVGLVSDSLTAVSLLSGFNFGAVVQGWHLAEQIETLRNILRTMVREFAEAAGEFAVMGDAVEAFSAAAESVVGLVEEGLRATTLLSQFDFGAAVQGWHLAGQIETFRNIIRTMVREFAEAAGEFAVMGDAVEAFSDAAEGVVGLVEDGLQAVLLLSEFDFGAAVQGWHLAGQIETFRNIIRTLIREFAEAAAEFGTMAGTVEAFADAAGAVVDLVEPAIEAIRLLASYSADTASIGASMQAFSAQLVALVIVLATAFQQAQAQIGEGLAAAAAFSDSAATLIDVVEPGIEALALVATYEAIPGIRIAAAVFAQQLVSILTELSTAFSLAATTAGGALAQAEQFAESAETILDVVEPGIEALAALATYEAIPGIRIAATVFAQQLVAILAEIANAFSLAAASTAAAIAQAAEFAEGAEAILDVVEPGIEALAALATFEPLSGIQASAASFSQQLVSALLVIGAALAAAATEAGAATAQAAVFAESAGAILDVVEPGIEALASLATFAPLSGIQANAASFSQQLVSALLVIGAALAAAATEAGAATAQAAVFAESAGAILDVVGPGVEALAALSAYVTASGLQASVQKFTADLVMVIQTLTDGLKASGVLANQAVVEAANMSDALQGLLGVVQPGIDAIGALADYTSKAGLEAKVKAFVSDLALVASLLVGGLTSAAAAIGQTAIAAATSFAEAVKKIAELISGAMAEMDKLAGAKMPDVKPILEYIMKSATEIGAAAQASGAIGNAAQGMATFAEEVGKLVQEVFNALMHLESLAKANTPGSVGAILDAMVNAFQSGVGGFSGAGEALASAFENGFRSGDYQGAGSDAAQGLIDGVQSQEGAASNAASDLIGAMLKAASSAAAGFTQVGKDIISGIVSGIQSSGNLVTTAVVNVLTSAINAAKAVINQAATVGSDLGKAVALGMAAQRSAADSSGASVGQGLIDGLRRAVAAGQSSVVNQIIATVRAAINAAQAALGINSPSKVFFQIGQYVTEGLRSGIEGGMAPVVRAVGRMAREVSDTMSNSLSISVPNVRLAGAMLPAPVTVSGVTPRAIRPQPITSPGLPVMRHFAAGAGEERETAIYNDVQVNVTFPNGAAATPVEIQRAVKAAVEEAMLKSGRRVDASQRLR